MKTTKWLALFGALALVLAACSPSDDDATATTADGSTTETTADAGTPDTTEAPDSGMSAGEGGLVTIFQWQAPSIVNPFLSGGTKDLLASSLVLEPLAEYDPSGQLVPALAAEIPTVANGGVSEDLTQLTWTLKDGVVWSDGSPFTADDVVFTYEYCTQTTSCTQSSFFDGITSVVADDATHVTITFDAPTPFPYNAFTTYQSSILHKTQFEGCVGDELAPTCTEENTNPHGTGPFVVDEFLVNDTVTYVMNPNYRGIADGYPFFGSALIKGGGDATDTLRSVLELDEGDYSWNAQVTPEVVAQMEAAGFGTVQAGFASLVERIMVNQTDPNPDLGDQRSEPGNPHPFLTDPAVWQALSMAIDRQALVDVGYGPSGRPTCNIWPGAPYASPNNDACLTQDIAGANALLEEAGYVDSDGDGIREDPDTGDPLFLLYQTSTNTTRQLNQDLIKANWAEIGIDVELRNIDSGVFFGGDQASPDTYQAFYADVEMYANESGSPDPQNYMSGLGTAAQIVSPANNFGGSNIARFDSAEFDALAAELATTGDLDKRIELVIAMNDLIVQNGAMIPLIYRGSASGLGVDIAGVGDINGWDSEFWNIEIWTRTG